MIRSLWIGATGMNAQQTNIDILSNDLSNVNNYGYKRKRAEFEDLIYQKIYKAGTSIEEETPKPVGMMVGYGSKVAATQTMFHQGSLEQTGNKLDMGIAGEGFFRVQLPDGSFAYTRDGTFKLDRNGQVVTSNGYKLIPEVVLPENFLYESITVTPDGRVAVNIPGQDTPMPVAQLTTYRFVNNAGLDNIGDNLFKETTNSGPSRPGVPGNPGFGEVHQGYLERSNVDMVNSMVKMIIAQRAYEFNSKSVTTSDSLLQTAIGMKR